MLTLSEMNTLRQLLDDGVIDRGTFYMKIFQAATDAGDTPTETAMSAALFQTQVSMFSGWLGGIALAANYLMTDGAKNTSSTVLGASGYSDYNAQHENEIYLISQQVALDFATASIADMQDVAGDGKLNVLEGVAAAATAWFCIFNFVDDLLLFVVQKKARRGGSSLQMVLCYGRCCFNLILRSIG